MALRLFLLRHGQTALSRANMFCGRRLDPTLTAEGLAMAEAFAVLQELTGVSAPKLRVPYLVALTAAHVNECMSSITGKPPKAPLAGVRMAKYKMFFNPAKAIQQLGLPQTPPRQALSDAVEWFNSNGYAK